VLKVGENKGEHEVAYTKKAKICVISRIPIGYVAFDYTIFLIPRLG